MKALDEYVLIVLFVLLLKRDYVFLLSYIYFLLQIGK